MSQKHSAAFWVTRTALGVALVVVAQLLGKVIPAGAVITGPFSVTQLVTGSLVNCVLFVFTATTGIWSGVAIGILSSVLATLIGIGPAVPARRKCIYGALARYLRSMRRFSLFSCLIMMQYHKVGEGNMCFFTYCSESTDFYSRKAIVTFMFMGAVFFLFVSLSCTICTERVLRGGSVQSFSAPGQEKSFFPPSHFCFS